jgi:hypothetical protein
MKLIRLLMFACALSLMFAETGSAVEVIFQLDGQSSVGAQFPSEDTYTPPFPIIGSGDIDFDLGTGYVTLQDHSFVINLDATAPEDDVRINITGWTQTISSIDASGNLTTIGSGATECIVLGGIGSLVCPDVPDGIDGWPPADGTALLSSAVIDTEEQTITVINNSVAIAGTITQDYSYEIVPEPSSSLLMSGSIVCLCAIARRRR